MQKRVYDSQNIQGLNNFTLLVKWPFHDSTHYRALLTCPQFVAWWFYLMVSVLTRISGSMPSDSGTSFYFRLIVVLICFSHMNRHRAQPSTPCCSFSNYDYFKPFRTMIYCFVQWNNLIACTITILKLSNYPCQWHFQDLKNRFICFFYRWWFSPH